MASEYLEKEAPEALFHQLARSIDPIGFETTDAREQRKRQRVAYAKANQAVTTYVRAVRESEKPSTGDWMKEAVMANELDRKGPSKDQMLALALELAALIAPAECSELNMETFNPAFLTEAQDYAVTVAAKMIQKVCAITEQEYAVYLFRNKAVVA